jgi:3-methyl-2-oxobutanoate hydroxymethyltransferase
MNILDFQKLKTSGRKISMVTCYDHWSAQIIEQSQVDCVLVGDSVSMVVHGFPSTVHATVDMMALHVEAVHRGLKTKLLIGDLPFMSYRKGINEAMNAVEKLMRAGAQAVKLEGVWGHEDVIKQIIGSGVPVMGHIGLTPQSVNGLGGFKVQGQDPETAEDLLLQARTLDDLGCFSIVAECVPSGLGQEMAESVSVPVIGIGAGPEVDGQVLVLHDLLGLTQGFKPRFLRRFLDGAPQIQEALNAFHLEVQGKTYPLEQESYL